MSDIIAFAQGIGLTLPVALMNALKALDAARIRPSTREILDLLIGGLEGSADAAELQKALTKAVWQEVQKEWDGLKARGIARLPEKFRPLAFRLGDIGEAIDMPLFSTEAPRPSA